MTEDSTKAVVIAVQDVEITQSLAALETLEPLGYHIKKVTSFTDIDESVSVLLGDFNTLSSANLPDKVKIAVIPNQPNVDIDSYISEVTDCIFYDASAREVDLRVRSALHRATLEAVRQRKGAFVPSSSSVEDEFAKMNLDSVTNLPNRVVFSGCIRDTMEASLQQEFRFAVVLLSLTNFHDVTNTLGYQNADLLLGNVGKRIGNVTRDMDYSVVLMRHEHTDICVASIAPMVFGMLMYVPEQHDVNKIVKKITAPLSQPYSFDGLSINIGVQVGMVVFPDFGENDEDLLRLANITLDTVTKNNTEVASYSPELDPYNSRRLSLMGDLIKAIENDALNLHYQPQMRLKDNKIVGCEALLRWTHETHGFIPPDEFIGLAEKTGVIKQLTEWVVTAVSKCAMDFMHNGHDVSFSINLSAKNLHEDELFAFLLDTLMTYMIPPESIVLEITESAMLQDPQQALKVLRGFSGMGLRISIDDFGTGYSSLGYLKQLPVTEMKIDRSFVRDMVTNSDDRVIVKTIIDMAHNLGLEVVAEGVEDKETMEMLRDMGCDYQQGYYLARPMPDSDFSQWLIDEVWKTKI